MKKMTFQWLSAAVVFGALASVIVSFGCGTSTPPPEPEVEEEPTEEYTEGEGSYYNE